MSEQTIKRDGGAMAERLVRFQRPASSLPYLTGADDARVAAVFGLDAGAYRELLDGFEERVRQAAGTLLGRPGFADLVDRLPLDGEPHIVAIGESTTADRLSWFEILRQVVTSRRPARFTNLAISGSTTTQALTGMPMLRFQRADLVLCMLGGNDAQRPAHGAPTLVGPAETVRNLAQLRELAGTPRWLWLTPSAVNEPRVAAYPHFQRPGISWSNRDIDAIADHLLGRPEPAVDTRHVTHHMDDGVHLTIEGQMEIASAVVHALAGAA
ncbi:SGNH/GDSL hydrolase family protein [Nonomuraea sp. NBC_01738]|uniref:SGNH/GDSL hydrolase family protein n=1 Tax=Nonomuraea sp. NBC_01738 TaxID=2976003 RepID=UPI002E1556D8|nr:SGNH/GDSL hydrolase family protein [Nonomuraea sp. NBC_01738]